MLHQLRIQGFWPACSLVFDPFLKNVNLAKIRRRKAGKGRGVLLFQRVLYFQKGLVFLFERLEQG